jgi:23S rRNA (uracil1939-C5)-methyltransferase
MAPSAPVRVESMAHDGRGVARVEGKAVFIEGALPGERVSYTVHARRRNFDEARVSDILEPAPERVVPPCPHFGVCGGCVLQHMAPDAQVRAKQQVLLDSLHHIGGLEPAAVFEPLTGPRWGYRRRARLGVKYVAKKGKVLVGFRERQGRYLADLERCAVLHASVGERLTELADLVRALHAFEHIPQIEVAVGDEATALVFRHLRELDEHDRARLAEYGRERGLQIHLQPGGPETVHALWPETPALFYRLGEFDIEIAFLPIDFTQVNADINRAMVSRAVALLDPQPDERVLDLFCGLGNFTLPIARRAREVLGVEGDAGLLERAAVNATRNGIANVRFLSADLATVAPAPWGQARFDKALLDPPRTGAAEVLGAVAASGARGVVYVSCNPATLARDAGVLVREHGFCLEGAGIMDMFPHTAHVESMAVFSRK